MDECSHKSCRQKSQRIIAELSSFLQDNKKPRLVLNDHCRICGYCHICRSEAQARDDLSLLSRITDREIKAYNRKGILSVLQLSHTFRFRRRSKRVKAQGRPHSLPLQALALRERRVYVVSKPSLAKGSTSIYVDMEGNTSGSFVYLIGVLAVDGGRETWRYFWADSSDEELTMFRAFLELAAKSFNRAAAR